MKTVAVVNPHAAGGRTGRALGRITRALARVSDTLEVVTTRGRGDATRLTSNALHAGARRIVAVGGDGTVGEVVNGYFHQRVALQPSAELAVLELGTGGDYRRSLGSATNIEEAVARMVSGTAVPVDVGIAHYEGPDGMKERCFANIASLGMSADVAARVDSLPRLKRYAGPLAFAVGAALSAVRQHTYRIVLTLDSGVAHTLEVALCAVCNGQYFGGGMHVAPMARLDDGRLDVIVVERAPRLVLLRSLRLLYTASHLGLPFVRHFRTSRVTIAVVAGGVPLPLELDGDSVGRSPVANFDVLPGALRLRR